ncbi:MAG: MFS transporter [Acidobacteria bacterium]|nr:MAG: MFS transporter [Acidobacteriota bacterium]
MDPFDSELHHEPKCAVGPPRRVMMFRSLYHRDFSIFWAGNFLSNIGTWMQYIALGWVILLVSNSPFLLGLNGFLAQIPSLAFALPGGAIADRLNRRKLMLITQTSMMLLALVLAILTSIRQITIREILAISFLTGIASALNYPAYQALIPDLVPREDLMNGIALNSAQFNMSRAIGPTAAGLAMGALGAAACFYLNSISFLALIIALLVITIPPVQSANGGHFWGSMMDGLRYLNEHRMIIVLLTVPAILSLLGLPFIVLMPAVARNLIGVGASGLGFLMGGAGLGAVAAALFIAGRRTPEHGGRLILTSATLFSLALIFLSRAHTFWVAFLLLAVMGGTIVGTLTLANTTLQMTTPHGLRGRVMAMYYISMTGLMPFGNLQAGVVAQTAGTRFALGLGGTVCLIYFLILQISLSRLRREGPLSGYPETE